LDFGSLYLSIWYKFITHRKVLHFRHVQCWNLSLCKSLHLHHPHSLDICSIWSYFLLLFVVLLYIVIWNTYWWSDYLCGTFLLTSWTQVLLLNPKCTIIFLNKLYIPFRWCNCSQIEIENSSYFLEWRRRDACHFIKKKKKAVQWEIKRPLQEKTVVPSSCYTAMNSDGLTLSISQQSMLIWCRHQNKGQVLYLSFHFLQHRIYSCFLFLCKLTFVCFRISLLSNTLIKKLN